VRRFIRAAGSTLQQTGVPVIASGCLAVRLWILSTASAQSLPNLNAQAICNRTFSVSWPYTNSGFALQESTDLTTAAWQPSALAPDFNSNTTTFTVSEVTTNAARFFRLKQPADLRGIYVVSAGLPLSTSNSAALAASFNVPGVDGCVLGLSWSNIEPTLGSNNWHDLDAWMSNAVVVNLKVNVAVRAGNDTPSWLFLPPPTGAGATPLTFGYSPQDGQTTNCQVETIAAPWDTNFLTAWDAMLTKLSTHLKNKGTYDAVKLLRLTGINRDTDELHLPAQTADSTGLDCVSNAPLIWQAAGYTPSNLLSGWSNILASFQTHFPDKSFSVAIIAKTNDNAFPPINDDGDITNVVPADQNRPLLALASQMFRGRLVIQNNSLYPDLPAQAQTIQSAQSLGTLIAFQTNEQGIGDKARCGGNINDPVACSNDTYLAMLDTGIYPLSPTNSLRAQYIEVFPADALVFTNAIWQAHQELFAAP